MLGVLEVVIPVFLVVGAGYGAVRSGLFPNAAVDGLLVVRLLGDSSERIRHLLQTCWQTCRAALDDTAPAVPRIWAT